MLFNSVLVFSGITSLTEAAASMRRRTLDQDENLVLVDCGIGLLPNGASTSRQMIYYSSAVWPDPSSNAANSPAFMVNVPWDGSYPWRSGGVSATTPNGDIWRVTIDPSVADIGTAGSATHTYDSTPLSCYSFHGTDVYTLDDGTHCTTAYVCNHQDGPRPGSQPTPTPTTPTSSSSSSASSRPTASFAHNNEGNPVTLVGAHSVSDIFALAKFQEDTGSGTKYCQSLSQPVTIKDSGKPGNPDCSVAFDCGPYNADMMFSVAKQILSSNSQAWNTSTQDLPACEVYASCLSPNACFYECMQGPDCWCEGKTSKSRDITSIASGKVVVDMLSGLPDAAQSRLTYQIVCPSASSPTNCGACKALTVGSVFLDLFTFGIASAVATVVCTADGC